MMKDSTRKCYVISLQLHRAPLLAYQTETPETGRPKSWSSTFTNPQRSQTSSAMSGNHFSSFPLKTTFDTLNNLMMSSDASVYVNKVVV